MVRVYDDYVKIFKDYDCKLITTNEEYESTVCKNKYKQFKIEYKCGHQQDMVYFNQFIRRKSNVLCNLCKDKPNTDKSKVFDIELASFLLIEDLLKDTFTVIRCVESCKSDLIIKPKVCVSDEWLPVQVKSTDKLSNNQYKFPLRLGYENNILLCICNSEKRIWGFQTIPNVKRINIGISKKHQYIDNELKKDELADTLFTYYQTSKKFKNSEINIASSNACKIEQEYITKRENALKSITFIKPERNQLAYDFMIGDKKFQEKTVNFNPKRKSNIFNFKLQKRNGVDNYCSKYINYDISDNNFYWLNIKNTDIFYVIPSDILYANGYLKIGDDIKDRKSNLRIDITNTEVWYSIYKFNYTSVDEIRLHNLINIK